MIDLAHIYRLPVCAERVTALQEDGFVANEARWLRMIDACASRSKSNTTIRDEIGLGDR
jgi:hypothetical protein